ncbi:hypothetical protein [Abyssisolibacter fermentans]|uniref:hypothetical protein n=1 Tax=Abyssisolibacter fermentans TaxID=1766203 RepID=UPI000832332E|nr:hypothetical protein [Abyssisolibacter fermentans]
MNIHKMISWLNVTRIILKVGGILSYISLFVINGNLFNGWQKFMLGNTTVYIPLVTKYQFSVIITIPLFILTLIGLQEFITILKSIENKKTPFTLESVTIFKNFSKKILVFGAIKVIIDICGNLIGIATTNGFSFQVVILIFPIEYVIAALMMLGVAYIVHFGLELQSENDMFI